MKIKLLIAIMLITLSCLNSTAQALVYNQGDTLTISFATLPYLGEADFPDTTVIEFPAAPWIVNCDLLGNCTVTHDYYSFRLDLYENRTDNNPAYSSIFDSSYLGLLIMKSINIYNPAASRLLWEDLEGKMELTLLSGPATLDAFEINLFSSGQVWGATFNTTPVPEPSTLLLLGAGLTGLVGLRLRRRALAA